MTNKEINAEKLNVELFELENKMKKLQEFVDSDDFLSISTINQILLANQMVGMAMYRDSLHKCIKLAENNIKYTVQVFPNRRGYLNVLQSEAFFLNTPEETSEVQTHFTQVEINEFKKQKDLAIDWDRVIIEPVKAEN